MILLEFILETFLIRIKSSNVACSEVLFPSEVNIGACRLKIPLSTLVLFFTLLRCKEES